jgi:3',5'-nucleoside bisphosphate phosphatase
LASDVKSLARSAARSTRSGIDLHIHTTASDGTLSPAEVLREARRENLAAIAITDHDTLAGVRDALAAGIPDGMEFLSGVEISAAAPPSLPMRGSFHLLGYAIRTDHGPLEACLADLRNSRKNRNPAIVARLRELGFDIRLEAVSEFAGGGEIGRPHIAGFMKSRGWVESIDEAFDRYIGNNGPAYADKYRVPCAEAVALLREAGGVAVVAHPGLLPVEPGPEFEATIAELRDMGTRGIEVFYPGHSPERTAYFAEIARRYDMVATGGTDFHGDIKPELRMGRGFGDFRVPFEIYDALLREATRP